MPCTIFALFITLFLNTKWDVKAFLFQLFNKQTSLNLNFRSQCNTTLLHSITCWSSLGYLGVKWPIIACFADIFSSPERVVARSLLQHCTMDLFSQYSWLISFILKAVLYEEWHAFGMMIKNNGDERDTLYCSWNVFRLPVTEIIIVVLWSHGSCIYKLCWINWCSRLFIGSSFLFILIH